MIHINNLMPRMRRWREPLLAAAASVIDSGRLVLGEHVEAFEAEFAAYLGTRHCLGLANGTDALELALRAVGVGHGDRVAAVANAGMYTTTALRIIGAEPVFMDVEPDSRCAALSEVQRVLQTGVRAVVVTHLYGLLTPAIEAMAALCASAGVPLVEDCAQAHGAELGDRKAGSFGDVAAYSFYPTKNLGALGDGGAVTTGSDAVASAVRLLRQYGWTSKYAVGLSGARNSRLDEIQAAMLRVFLPALDEDNARRREIADYYNREIVNPLVAVPGHTGAGYVAHLYVVGTAHREALRSHMQASGVGVDVHYPIPDHRQPVMGDRYAGLELKNTERLAGEILTLPCYPGLTDDECKAVARAVNAFRV